MSHTPEEVIVMETEHEVIEIEIYVREKKQVPKAKKYIIRIDGEKREVNVPKMTGAEILGLVNKKPDAFNLYEIVHGKKEKIEPGQEVHFRHHGRERFCTLPLKHTEG